MRSLFRFPRTPLQKIVSSVLILGILFVGVMRFAAAQPPLPPDTTLPPAIINFSADLPAVTVDALEKHSAQTHLSWEVVNLPATDSISLQIYQLNQWGDVFPGETLAASDTRQIAVEPPLGFGPPTYRLAILNAQKQVFEERILTIPYDMQAMSSLIPQIASFTSSMQSILASSIHDRRAQVPVSWMVTNRLPNSNITFEQVMPDGSTVPIELARPFLWLPSTGNGVVAPMNPQQTDQPVTLRMRVVDMTNGNVYASADVVLPVVADSVLISATPVAGGQPTQSPARGSVNSCASFGSDAALNGHPGDGCNVYNNGNTSVKINAFTLTDQHAQEAVFGAFPRGDWATVNWDVSGNVKVLIDVYELSPLQSGTVDQPRETSELASSGSTGIFLGGEEGGVRVILWAYDASGTTVSEPYHRLAYSIIDVPHLISPTLSTTCIPTYHFTSPDVDPHGCDAPVGHGTVNGAYEPFEGGFMLWFESNVYVMRKDGSYTLYVESQYADLPDNPVTDTPPVGRSSPINGFGRVWGNYPEVRNALGWALGPEQGYTMSMEGSEIQTYFYLTLPDGTVIQIHNAPVWNIEAPP